MDRAGRLVLLAAGLAASGGCGDAAEAADAGDPRCAQLEHPATLELGQYTWNDRLFVEMAPGAEMEVTINPYGSWWVLPAIRARGIYPGGEGPPRGPDDPVFGVEVYAGEDRIGYAAPARAALEVGADGAGVAFVYAVFDGPCGDVNEIECVLGSTATLRGEITDTCGNTATAALNVLLCGGAQSSYPCSD